MKNLFAYGTLMCNDIMEEVSGCSLSHVPGILKGYVRRSIKGEHYPGITPDKENQVEGVVYRNIPESAWDRLDKFEGEMYSHQVVQIELSGGKTLDAETYVVKPDSLDRIEESDWDFGNFLRAGKEDFQRKYKGYRALGSKEGTKD